MLSVLTVETSATFIVAVTIVIAQIIQYLKSNKNSTIIIDQGKAAVETSKSNSLKLDAVHEVVNGRYVEALSIISTLSTRLADITKNPTDITAATAAQKALHEAKPNT